MWSGGLRNAIGAAGSPDQPFSGVSLGLSATLVVEPKPSYPRAKGRYRVARCGRRGRPPGFPKRDPKGKRLHPAFDSFSGWTRRALWALALGGAEFGSEVLRISGRRRSPRRGC